MLRGPVLAATNLTPGADALRQAAPLAHDLGASLIVCHVMPELLRIGTLFPQWRGVEPGLVQSMTAKARSAVDRELASVLGDRILSTRIVLDSGTPHVGVLAQAARVDAGVVVVGPGHVAVQVARHAPVPVLVARPSRDGCVVGATDFSDASLRTLRLAAAEAGRRGVPLHLIYALDLGLRGWNHQSVAQPYLEGLAGVALDGADELQAAAEQRLRELLRDFAGKGHSAVVSGHAENAIVQYAERVGAGLVVVGRHGASGFAQLTLGSTATGVVESSPCSVLVSGVGTPEPVLVTPDTAVTAVSAW
jgi:nucleotide-binding universal stress UspA family protein